MPGSANHDTTDDSFLGGSLRILQPARGYRAGLDAVLLAAAAPAAEAPSNLLDAGSGVGVAGLCYAQRTTSSTVTLVENAPQLAELARLNIARNGLEKRVCAVEADILAPPANLEQLGLLPERFELLIANPPFDIAGRGRAPPDPVKAGANIMPIGDLDRWMRFLARMAAPGGIVTVIHRAEALEWLLGALGSRFGAIEVMPIYPRAHQSAHRILVRGRKGSKAPLVLHRGLVLHGPTGNDFTSDVGAILRHGAPLTWPPS